ncbi:hypothetical protein C8R44DRAFT_725227 [Mycena epipterygia]|nr:hypothetical protein C8R44DRAFT_725227 [Mycena epipterygia]
MSGFLADVFPLLLYIPALLGPFKLTARPWALAANNMVAAPYLFVRRCRECDNLLRVEALEDEQMGNEEAARSLYVFFLAIFLAPGAAIFAFFSIPPLKKLRATRYPTPWAGRVAFPDREHLLYVSALVTEHRSPESNEEPIRPSNLVYGSSSPSVELVLILFPSSGSLDHAAEVVDLR